MELVNGSHDQELERQYDLTPVMSSLAEHRRPTTPSYSIDPWEVVTSPVGSLDSGGRPRAIVDRTPADGDRMDSDSYNNRSPSNNNNNRHGSFDDCHRDDNGYDPDDDEEEDDLVVVNNVPANITGVVDCHINGVARNNHPANRFLVPSDIHPNMEQREEDIAQLRLLAGKLNADWRGQDFMAPALAR